MRKILITLFSTVFLIAYASGDSVEWGYEGEIGPKHWGCLSKEYKLCNKGTFQSPIDLKPDLNARMEVMRVHYRPSTYSLKDTGHSLEVIVDEGNYFEVEGDKYKLMQMHFHTPSEYTVNGKAYPMAVHLVHQNQKNELGVISVLFEEGKPNPAVADLWARIPNAKKGYKKTADVLNIGALLPENRFYYRLMGSLTTPPCTEGVNWFIMQKPISASKQQIARHIEIWGRNARPLQDKGHRLVIKGN